MLLERECCNSGQPSVERAVERSVKRPVQRSESFVTAGRERWKSVKCEFSGYLSMYEWNPGSDQDGEKAGQAVGTASHVGQ